MVTFIVLVVTKKNFLNSMEDGINITCVVIFKLHLQKEKFKYLTITYFSLSINFCQK